MKSEEKTVTVLNLASKRANVFLNSSLSLVYILDMSHWLEVSGHISPGDIEDGL